MSGSDRGKQRGPTESLMDFFIRTRGAADPAIDRDVERSCTSKQPYASEDEARAVAAMNGMKLFTYHCRYCDFWHLTRRPTSGNTQLLDD
jgi:hypothetical protein